MVKRVGIWARGRRYAANGFYRRRQDAMVALWNLLSYLFIFPPAQENIKYNRSKGTFASYD